MGGMHSLGLAFGLSSHDVAGMDMDMSMDRASGDMLVPPVGSN